MYAKRDGSKYLLYLSAPVAASKTFVNGRFLSSKKNHHRVIKLIFIRFRLHAFY